MGRKNWNPDINAIKEINIQFDRYNGKVPGFVPNEKEKQLILNHIDTINNIRYDKLKTWFEEEMNKKDGRSPDFCEVSKFIGNILTIEKEKTLFFKVRKGRCDNNCQRKFIEMLGKNGCKNKNKAMWDKVRKEVFKNKKILQLKF